jgi:hypothetical protein
LAGLAGQGRVLGLVGLDSGLHHLAQPPAAAAAASICQPTSHAFICPDAHQAASFWFEPTDETKPS